MRRQIITEQIIEHFSLLKLQINTYNSAGLYNIDVFCEDFFQRLLNMTFGYNLKNINTLTGLNFPAIDLGDNTKRIAFQVTADSSKNKVQTTINLFQAKGLDKSYDTLNFLVLRKKVNHDKTIFTTANGFKFDKDKCIYSIDDLIAYIRERDIDELEKIHGFLEKELVEKTKNTATKTIAKEVETIMDLIEYLSNHSEPTNQKTNDDPDPERKIYKRFSDYSPFLISQIEEFIPQYANARKEAIDKIGLDTIKAKRIAMYLKVKSDAVLLQNNGNPQLAVASLTDYFERNLSEKGKTYDYNAIRYYLIQEIINCNVFPNDYKRESN